MSFSELINGNKLPVLFIGSGFSRRYLNAPTWEALLINVYEFMGKQELDYKTLKAKLKNRKEYKDAGNGQLNAVIAEEIESEFNEHFYTSELAQQFPEWIQKEVNPFRQCIAEMLMNLEILPEKETEIKAFKELKNKVMSVITTNYDSLIEDLLELPQESTFVGQSQLFSPNSVDLGELYKIHGSVTEPDNIIITQTDYDNYKANAKLFSAKLLTLISENPVIFIGYSIDDPNMQQTLIDLIRCLSKEQIATLKKHFYIVEFEPGLEEIHEKEFILQAQSYQGEKTTFPITVLSTDNYLELFKRLNTLTPAMNISTVKQVKRIVKDIVIESVESKQKSNVMSIFMDDISKLNNPDQKFAIAIGNAKDINSTYGYNLRPAEDVYEDVLFDNRGFNKKRLITETFETSYLKIKRIIPIYKYIDELDPDDYKDCPNVMAYLGQHVKKEDYLNNSLIKSISNMASGNQLDDMPHEYEKNPNKMYFWIMKNFESLPIEEVGDFLRSEFEKYYEFDKNRQGHLRRLISIYDLFKFK